MIKLDNTGSEPFNFNRIPLWLYPDLFEETIEVGYRGGWFIVLYVISTLLNTLLISGPISIAMLFGGGNGAAVVLYIWLAVGIPFGILIGLFMWRDFNQQKRKSQEEKQSEKL